MIDMAKPNSLWIARTRLHRLVRWIDGVETEFAVSFDKLSENEKQLLVQVLKGITDELDDYYDTDGMPSARQIAVITTVQERPVTPMKEPVV